MRMFFSPGVFPLKDLFMRSFLLLCFLCDLDFALGVCDSYRELTCKCLEDL